MVGQEGMGRKACLYRLASSCVDGIVVWADAIKCVLILSPEESFPNFLNNCGEHASTNQD